MSVLTGNIKNNFVKKLHFLAYSWHGKLESVYGLKRLSRKHF